jgi:very-short-patch-repair endonuclease
MGASEKSWIGFQDSSAAPHMEIYCGFLLCRGKLVIEIDGDSHVEPDQEEYDKARTEWLKARGYKVIRIMNKDVHRHLEDALNEIYLTRQERTASLKSTGERKSL